MPPLPEANIRTAEARDAAEIASLLKRSISEICGKDYPEASTGIDAWTANKTPENIGKWIQNPKQSMIVAEHEGTIHGVGLIGNDGEIYLCYVLPESIGKGYGNLIFERLVDIAREKGLTELTLSSTLTARQFYLSKGFRELGEDVHHGEIRCVKMVKELIPSSVGATSL
jgi:GNAT superfamily N-acetyltransferase